MDWLDTETKALLGGAPPGKLSPPDTMAFTLVLLSVHGCQRNALVRALQRVAEASQGDAEHILGGMFPAPVKKGLSYADAQLGQIELICCDAVSVFIVDTVVAEAPADYLANAYAKLLRSEEFELVSMRIDSIPAGPSGRMFCDRFLDGSTPRLPAVVDLMRKKARIMSHWAAKIGGQVAMLSRFPIR
jgi:hypothetical protein